MPSNKVKLGTLIEPVENRNSNEQYSLEHVRGIATSKIFIDTKANMDGVPLTSYKIVEPDMFAFVSDTSRRGDKISLAYNDSEIPYLVSSISTVFQISNKNELLSDFLFIYFNRPEFDRYTRFNSWGSARETFSWEDMCDIDIELPPLPIQQKYVDIYKAMVENQQTYERGLDDLKLVCDAYIEDLDSYNNHAIGNYIERNKKRNQNGIYGKLHVKGFNNDGEFIKPMRLFSGDISKFKIIEKGDFVYNSRINSTIKKLSIAFNEDDTLIVSPAYESFFIKPNCRLYPFYLYMLLQREIFAKKVLFNSFGSSTLVFSFEDLCQVEIPVPDIKIQKSIANIYSIYKKRKEINEKLKALIKEICPILIKGSIEEAKRAVEV